MLNVLSEIKGTKLKNLDMRELLKFYNFSKAVFSKLLFVTCVLVIWQIVYFLQIFPKLLFPSFTEIFSAFLSGIFEGKLIPSAITSLSLIFQGLVLGIFSACVLAGLAITCKIGRWIVDNTVFIMNPIPGLAIFPLCILFFGFGKGAMLFILIHSVLWGFLLNILAGIDSMPKIYREIGQILELSKFRMAKDIYLPACMPYVIPGLKAAWARAWRSAIGIELVAGVMVGNAGLGWLMTYQRGVLDTPGLYASLIIIIIIGLIMEALFGGLEKTTVKKWGMMQ